MSNYSENISHEINGLTRKSIRESKGVNYKLAPLSSKEKHIQKLIKYSLMSNGVFL